MATQAAQSLRKLTQHTAYRIVLLQLVGVCLIALIALLLYGTLSGIAVLLGGLAYCLPSLVFVWRVFRYVGASQATQFVIAFFVGEMLKLVLSAVLVVVIVKYLPVSLLSVLIGFMGAIVSFWVVCLITFSR